MKNHCSLLITHCSLDMATVDKNYLYSIGRVRELEKGLLTKTHLDRVLESDDPLAVLRSMGFFKSADDHEKMESHHELFVLERESNRRQLHELIADSPLEDIFLLPYDIDNIKLFLKAKLTGNAAIKERAVEEGKFRKSEILEAIYDELPTQIPSSIMDEVKAITEAFQTTQRFSLVDTQLDRKLRGLQLDIAQQAKSPFMIEYLQRLSDTQNISTTIRRKFYRLGRDSLAEMLFETGTLVPSFFERVYDGGWESMTGAFKPTDYDKLVSHVIAEVNQESFLPTLDLNCANYMIEFLQKAKHISFGIEPVIAFCLALDNGLKVVQTVLSGKLFNFPHEKMQQRMRELYS